MHRDAVLEVNPRIGRAVVVPVLLLELYPNPLVVGLRTVLAGASHILLLGFTHGLRGLVGLCALGGGACRFDGLRPRYRPPSLGTARKVDETRDQEGGGEENGRTHRAPSKPGGLSRDYRTPPAGGVQSSAAPGLSIQVVQKGARQCDRLKRGARRVYSASCHQDVTRHCSTRPTTRSSLRQNTSKIVRAG